MQTDPILAAVDVAEAAVREMIDTAAAVEAASSSALLRSESREEFLGHLNVAACALKNGEVAQRALAALVKCRAMLTGPSRGFRANRNRRRVRATLDRVMAEIGAVIPVAAPVQ